MTEKTITADNTWQDTSSIQHPWLIVITVMLISMLELLDTTVVNVSLRNMMASLNADQNQITWVVTAYLTASAIMLPLTGFLINRAGQKTLLMINVIGFMLASVLCGLAANLPEMVSFRILQGIFGSSLISLSQITLKQTFPKEQQAKAMAIWGFGIMVAPSFGPTLGGFITEYMNWRWIFYINVPICLIGCLLTAWVIPSTPKRPHAIHWPSLILMILGIGCLQLFLDKGNDNQWLQSNPMLLLLSIGSISLIGFIIYCFFLKKPLVDLRLYKDRNFAVSCLIIIFALGTVSAVTTLEPLMLETIFQYSTLSAGKIMAALGVGSAVAIILSPWLMRRTSIQVVAWLGLLMAAYSVFRLIHITMQANLTVFLIDNLILGGGIGFLMTPINVLALSNITPLKMPEAAGLYTYGRMLGASIAVSLSSTIVASTTQQHWHTLIAHLNPFSSRLQFWFANQHLPWMSTAGLAPIKLELEREAGLMGFLSCFRILALIFLFLIVLVFLLKKPPKKY